MDTLQPPPRWNDRSLAGWLKHNSPEPLTLSQAWRMAHDLSKGPLADVWQSGVIEGMNRAAGEFGPAWRDLYMTDD